LAWRVNGGGGAHATRATHEFRLAFALGSTFGESAEKRPR